MSWYSAKVLYESKVSGDAIATLKNGDGINMLMEESIFLLQAENIDEATHKAQEIATSNEHTYKNGKNEQVSWTFSKVLDIQDLCEDTLYEGVEVYSHLYYS